MSRCDDFREIAPGLWYPFRVTIMAFEPRAVAQGRLLVNWRHDYTFESVTVAPKVDDALFHDVLVPQGTKVEVVE